MQLTTFEGQTAAELGRAAAPKADFSQYKTIRRNGAVVPFEPVKISIAMTKAFLAVMGHQGATSASLREKVAQLSEQVASALMRRKPEGGAIHIEDIQDQVELSLMRFGEHDVARAYVLYREQRSQERAARGEALTQVQINVVRKDGRKLPLDVARLRATIESASQNLAGIDIDAILSETLKNIYDGVSEDEVNKSAILAPAP
ncbi:ATP cone domain-containing protein [Chromobacterium haemolyticum]|uniref:ATP cone domain-containing protein n=1 Tax=Chromobacterium haemolyticum TaxID=394935 RepID=UPI0023DD1533|nr:ATP cone domain-containing protein [Chromobacterium haemolyticum]